MFVHLSFILALKGYTINSILAMLYAAKGFEKPAIFNVTPDFANNDWTSAFQLFLTNEAAAVPEGAASSIEHLHFK